MTTLVLPATILFGVMGVVALVRPERILALFGTPSLTLAGRNEVRAVYGGFGVVCAGLLLWALARPGERGPVFLSLGVALWGMALGRLVSLAVDRRASGVVWLSLAGELALGACLASAWARSG